MKTSLRKKLTKLSGLFLGLAMAVGVGVAVSSNQDAMPVHAALTASDISSTAATSVEDGAKYVIASGTTGNVYLAAKASNTWGTAVAIGSAYEFTAEGSGTSGFALKCKDGYLTPKTSSSNTFLAYGSTKVTCSLSNGVIVSAANNSYQLRQNGTSGYRWYSSSTGTVAKLYKINDAKLPLLISGDSTVYNGKTITLSASSNGTAVSSVTWSSSNTGVATVSNTGVVTGVNGTTDGVNVTITAKKDGYEDATKTITVKADTKTLKSISASGAKSTFTLGDSFETTDLVVTGTYSHTNGDADSQEEITTGITTSPTAGTELNTVGNHTITVSAGGKSTSYSISVKYDNVTSITPSIKETDMGPKDVFTYTASILPVNANPNYTVSASSTTLVEDEDYMFSEDGEVLILENPKEGTLILTFTSTGTDTNKEHKTCTTTINVKAKALPVLQEFKSSGTPSKATQYRNDTFTLDLSGVVITGYYDTAEPETFNSSDFTWNTTGIHPVGTYKLNTELTVTVNEITLEDDYAVSIAVTEDMTYKSYIDGQKWNSAGLSIAATMASGATNVPLTAKGFTFNPEKASAGDTTVQVSGSYELANGKVINSPYKTITGISVEEIKLTSITLEHTNVNKDYTLGQKFDSTNLVVTGHYNDWSTKSLTSSEYTITEPNMFEVNSAAVVSITADNCAAQTFTINVHAKQAESGDAKIWSKVTSLSDLDESAQYTIVSEEMGYQLTGFSDSDTVYGTYEIYTSLDALSEKLLFNLETISTDSNTYKFSIATDTGKKYLSCTESTKKNDLFLSSAGTTYEISFNENEDIRMFYIGYDKSNVDKRVAFNKQSGQYRFAGYKETTADTTTQYTPIQLYKLTTLVDYDVIKLDASLTATRDLYEGQSVSVADFAPITAMLNDGKPAFTVTADNGVTITSGNPLKAGNNTITLSYKGFTCDVPVNGVLEQKKEVASISLGVKEGTTAKTNYYLEDGITPSWNFNNIEITIKYSTGEEDEVLTIEQAINNYGATISPQIPTKNTDGFTVNMEVLGVSIGTNGHFSATVKDKAISGINELRRTTENQILNYFEGDGFKMDGINSVTFDMNDGSTTNVKKESFDSFGIKIGLVSTTKATTLDYELQEGTILPSTYDGYYLAVAYGDFIKATNNKVTITRKINDILQTGATASTSWDLVTSNSELIDGDKYLLVGEKANNKGFYVNGSITGTNKYLDYVDVDISNNSFAAAPDNAAPIILTKSGDNWLLSIGEYNLNTSGQDFKLEKDSADVYSISINTDGTAKIKSTESGDAQVYSNSGSPRFKPYNNAQQGVRLYHYKAAAYSNIDPVAQHAVIEFTDYVNTQLANICGTSGANYSDSKALDKSSAQGYDYRIQKTWADITKKYSTTVGALTGDQKTLAENMLASVTAQFSEDKATVGTVEHAMAIYDYVYSLYSAQINATEGTNFIGRSITPHTGNRISLFGENSLLGEATPATWIITIIALAGIAATGGYFYIRKRKED